MELAINIDYSRNYYYTPQIIGALSPIFECNSGDMVTLNINLDSKYPINIEDLSVIVSAYNYLKSNNITVMLDVTEPSNRDINNYVKRVDFFKSLEIAVDEEFFRRDSTGRFLEITPFMSNTEATHVHRRLMEILIIQHHGNTDLLANLDFCIWELLDNVIQHAESGGIISAQYIPSKNKIKIHIIDNGIGISKSIRKNKKYLSLAESEVLSKVIEKGVTNGKGMGAGLYFASKYAKLSGGQLYIHSGNNTLSVFSNENRVENLDLWLGTSIYLEIRTNSEVLYKELLEDDTRDPQNDLDILFG